jgi:hypothetical protein
MEAPVKKLKKVRRLKVKRPEQPPMPSEAPKPLFPRKAEPVPVKLQDEVQRVAEKAVDKAKEAEKREQDEFTSQFMRTMRNQAIKPPAYDYRESDLTRKLKDTLFVRSEPVNASNFPLESQQKLSKRLKGGVRNFFIYSNAPHLLGGKGREPVFLGNVEVSVRKLDDFERPNSKSRDLPLYNWLQSQSVAKDHVIAQLENVRALWNTEKAMQDCNGLGHHALDKLLETLKGEHHWVLFLPMMPVEQHFAGTRSFKRFSSLDMDKSEFVYWLKRL